MNIRIIHPFRFTGPWDKILKDVDSISKFENRIKKLCDIDTDYLTEDEKGNKIRTFLGDAFEVFAEALIKTHPYDRRFGITNYRPCHPNFGNEDHGVDGYGIGTNLNPATVQVKFKGDPTLELTANGSHLVNFKNSSHEEYNVNFADTDNMLIITNCKGVNYYTEEKMLNKKVRCFGRAAIKSLVDNNLPFWQEFRRATEQIVQNKVD